MNQRKDNGRSRNDRGKNLIVQGRFSRFTNVAEESEFCSNKTGGRYDTVRTGFLVSEVIINSKRTRTRRLAPLRFCMEYSTYKFKAAHSSDFNNVSACIKRNVKTTVARWQTLDTFEYHRVRSAFLRWLKGGADFLCQQFSDLWTESVRSYEYAGVYFVEIAYLLL